MYSLCPAKKKIPLRVEAGPLCLSICMFVFYSNMYTTTRFTSSAKVKVIIEAVKISTCQVQHIIPFLLFIVSF